MTRTVITNKHNWTGENVEVEVQVSEDGTETFGMLGYTFVVHPEEVVVLEDGESYTRRRVFWDESPEEFLTLVKFPIQWWSSKLDLTHRDEDPIACAIQMIIMLV